MNDVLASGATFIAEDNPFQSSAPLTGSEVTPHRALRPTRATKRAYDVNDVPIEMTTL